jgi:hypothetical protein
MAGPVRREKKDLTGRKSATTISRKIEMVSKKARHKFHGIVSVFLPMAYKIKSKTDSTTNRGRIMNGNMPSGIAKPDTKMNMTNQVQRTFLRYPVHITMRPMRISASVSLPASLCHRTSSLISGLSPLKSP